MDLIEELRSRAVSYRQGGPSSEHTAMLLEHAADALDRARRKNETLLSIVRGVGNQMTEVYRAHS